VLFHQQLVAGLVAGSLHCGTRNREGHEAGRRQAGMAAEW
jgi:hypothetical protein